MAECKDCVHFEVCGPYTEPNESYPEVGGCPGYRSQADFVNVVQCKDCKHYFHYGKGVYGCRTFGMMKTKPDGFCSYGERKYK